MDNIFTVLPMSQEFDLAAGQEYNGSIKIVNPADAKEDFQYKVGVSPYGVNGDEYEADLATKTNRTQIADWITIDESTGSLKPNETREIQFRIKVPENAPAGGQYAAITVSSNDDIQAGDGVAVKNIFEMASLIYANVEGETIHSGAIKENTVPGFVTSTPVTVTAELTNDGNVHENAAFRLTVKNAITGETILPTADNDGQFSELIMPETTRVVSREINNLPIIGVVNVSQTIYYNGETSTMEQSIVICPVWFMVAVGVTIGAIVTLITRLVIRHKRKRTMM